MSLEPPRSQDRRDPTQEESGTPGDTGGPGPGPLAWVGLAILIGGLFFFRLGQDVPMRSHEALVAETARNMVLERPVQLADGSRPSPWLVPNFDSVPRLRKTPLPYWTVAVLARATGEVNEWTARLPSALAAAGTVLLLMALVRRQCDHRTALLAGVALATSMEFLLMARMALADMPMTFFCTASLAALWLAVETHGGRRFGWLLVAGATAGLAMMAKGPAPALVFPAPYLVAAVIMVARLVRAGRQHQAGPADWAWTLGGAVAAALVFLAIALPWPAYVYLRVPLALEIWRAESVDRSTGEYGHRESVFFYLVRLPVLLAPWTVFLVGGIVMAIRRARERPASLPWWLFVGAWGVGTFVAFSAAAGKQDHYILPLIPAAAVFAGLAMRRWLAPGRPPRAPGPPAAGWAGRCVLVAHGIASILLGLIGVVAYGLWLAGPATLTHLRLPQALMTSAVMSPAAILGGTAIVGGVIVCLLAVRRRLTAGLAVLVATFAVAFLWAWPTLMGPLDRSTTALEFARQVRRQVPADMPLFSFAGANNMLVYQIQRPLVVLATPGTVQDQVGRGRPFYLICEERHLEALAPVAGLERVVHVPAPYQPREGYWLFHNASVTGG